MALKEILAADLKAAMKDKDLIRKNTVQMVRSSILQYEKDNLKELDEDGILEVIAKELKKRRDVLPEYEKKRKRRFDSRHQTGNRNTACIFAYTAFRRGAYRNYQKSYFGHRG